MLKKTNFIYLNFISILAPLLFSPNLAIADPKTDIANYEAAFDKGDILKAIELGEIAFSNAKRDLEPNNAYIAKIGFDLASLYIETLDDTKAYIPIKTAYDFLNANAEATASADMKQVEAIYAIALFAKENENKDTKKYESIKLLEKASSQLPKDFENSAYATRANFDLSLYYSKINDWKNLARVSDDLIKSTLIAYPNDKAISDMYLIYAYSFRGASIFATKVRSVNAPSSKTKGSILSSDNTPVQNRTWPDALADIKRARKIYGKPKNIEDKAYYGFGAWESLIIAYATQVNNSVKIANEYETRINDELGIKKTDIIDDSEIKNEKICSGKIKLQPKIDYPIYMTQKYYFAATIAMVDISNDNKISNIRIMATIPDKEFGKLVEDGLKKSAPALIAPDAPEICKKDYILNVRFVVR